MSPGSTWTGCVVQTVIHTSDSGVVGMSRVPPSEKGKKESVHRHIVVDNRRWKEYLWSLVS